MIFQTRAKLIKNVEVAKKYYKILLFCPRVSRIAQPGQFIELKISDNYEPLLRRPFSIHRIRGRDIEILYEVVGTGTEILSRKESGENLDILGPLGCGFDLAANNYNRTSILVAGGIGVAPLFFLAEKIAEIKNPSPVGRQEKSILRLRSGLMVSDPSTSSGSSRAKSRDEVKPSKIKNIVLIGGRTKNDILCEREFKEAGCAVKISTDDGSGGFKGKATDLLKHLLSTINYRLSTIYACGPRPMLKTISQIARDYKIPCQVSLEEHMACGIGACLGCVVQTKHGYQRVCKEGPVFNAHEIIWE
jgi:dihydroorotate dehydrogenase electron transfer subunit